MSDPPNDPATRWQRFRAQMPVTSQWAYFDHAAVSPLPEPARAAIVAWAQDAATQGDTAWPAWSRRIEELRQSAARLIGAQPDEIALVRNTTEGINLSFTATATDPQQADETHQTLRDDR